MAYNLNDQMGHLSHGPTISGLKMLKADMIGIETCPLVENFIVNGALQEKDLPDFANQCRRLAGSIKDPNVKSTLANLANSAEKAQGFLALTG